MLFREMSLYILSIVRNPEHTLWGKYRAYNVEATGISSIHTSTNQQVFKSESDVVWPKLPYYVVSYWSTTERTAVGKPTNFHVLSA
jgi:hypothetical protein